MCVGGPIIVNGQVEYGWCNLGAMDYSQSMSSSDCPRRSYGTPLTIRGSQYRARQAAFHSLYPCKVNFQRSSHYRKYLYLTELSLFNFLLPLPSHESRLSFPPPPPPPPPPHQVNLTLLAAGDLAHSLEERGDRKSFALWPYPASFGFIGWEGW